MLLLPLHKYIKILISAKVVNTALWGYLELKDIKIIIVIIVTVIFKITHKGGKPYEKVDFETDRNN